MAVLEITPQQRLAIEEAAALDGKDPSVWLDEAIRNSAYWQKEGRDREAARRPAPWQGWTFLPVKQHNNCFCYEGPRGAELFFHPRNRQRVEDADSLSGNALRRWSVRTHECPLRDRSGRMRTFATAEAAISALYASPEFSSAPAVG
jgi:hypothetical protein